MATTSVPAPAGYERVFVKQFRHWKTGKIIRACDHGKEAFSFLVKKVRRKP
jgi:hypothetical protein